MKQVKATLTISRPGESRELPLDPRGVLIGRDPKCDVVLDNVRISRRHARLFRDPFDRWIIEDLDSRHGVLIGGERVRAHAVAPGERVMIGPYALYISEPIEQDIAPDPSVSTICLLTEEAEEVQVTPEAQTEKKALPRVWLQELNRIVDRMDELTAPGELYPEVCRCLATAPGTVALVVRLPRAPHKAPTSPEILACHFGGESETSPAPQPPNLHLSRRVLEAVRSTDAPKMAKSVHSADSLLTLTVEDEQTPRAVLSVPVSDGRETVDALYLDIPFDPASGEIFDFVQAVARQVRLARKSLLLLEFKTQKRVLDNQLSMAQNIQTRLTPTEMPRIPGVDIAVHYAPAMWVGGDYFDIWRLPDGRLAFAVGDVSGKGLPAAMVMSNLQAALRTATSFCSDPADAISHVNRHLCAHLPEDMFVTLFFGLFDPQDGRLEYVNAGHILPLLIRREGPVMELGRPENSVLGVWEHAFTADIETLVSGSAFLAVTDGITESMSDDDEEFGIERLKSLIKGAMPRTTQQLLETVTTGAASFRGFRPQQDDITVFALHRCHASE